MLLSYNLFFTNTDSGPSLGMAIARTGVDQHAAHLDIRSQLRRGTQARVLLPLGTP